MIRFVLQLAPPSRVEKISVIAVLVTQGEAAQVPGHRPGRDNQGPVTLIEKVDKGLSLTAKKVLSVIISYCSVLGAELWS